MRVEWNSSDCPGCGRRFQIVLEDKSEVEDYDTATTTGPIMMIGGRGVALVKEGEPMIFDIKEFRYTYKCKHCGHEWTETRLQDKDATELREQEAGISEEGEID